MKKSLLTDFYGKYTSEELLEALPPTLERLGALYSLRAEKTLHDGVPTWAAFYAHWAGYITPPKTDQTINDHTPVPRYLSLQAALLELIEHCFANRYFKNLKVDTITHKAS